MKLINEIIDTELLNEDLYDRKGNFRPTHDFEASEAELDRVLGGAYKNVRKYQPNKQGMRVRWSRDSRANGIVGFVPPYNGEYCWSILNAHLEGHIAKWVGRSFDDCLADLKTRFFTDKDWESQAAVISFRKRNKKHIWYHLKNRFIDNFTGVLAEYDTDNQGNIISIREPRKTRKRDVVLYTGGEIFYKVKPLEFKQCEDLFQNLRSDVVKEVFNTGRISKDTADRLRQEIDISYNIAFRRKNDFYNIDWHRTIWAFVPPRLVVQIKAYRFGYHAGELVLNYAFECVDNREKTVLKVGSPEWRKYHKGRFRKTKPEDKGPFYDRCLWAAKHKNELFSYNQLIYNDTEDLCLEQFTKLFNGLYKTPRQYVGLHKGQLKDLYNRMVAAGVHKQLEYTSLTTTTIAQIALEKFL